MSQQKKFALLRIVFGAVWLIDAYFKWQPAFFANFTEYLSGAADGQPFLVHQWIGFWVRIVGVNPHAFALLVALSETALALGLIFGFFTRPALYAGMALAAAIWSTAEGFGGPYRAGSTDIGSAAIYVIVFVALLDGKCWERWSADAWLARRRRRRA